MKFLPGRKHPKAVYPKVEKTVIRIVIKHPEWGCRKISDELLRLGTKLSYVQVNSLLGRIGAETYDRRVNFARNYSGPGRLLPDTRLEIVNKSFGGESISKLAKEYSVSRDTIYRWVEKYNQGNNLKDNYVTAENHPKAVYPKLAEKVLYIVSQNPSLSVHSIAKNLPISSWTVWNILKRNNLSTVSARMAYASNRKESDEAKVVPQSFGRTKSVFEAFTPNLAPAPPPSFFSLLKFPVIFSIVLFFLVYGSLFWINLITKSTPASGFGLVLATISLGAGSFFFLYSLKYYLTTTILLSFSNKDNKNRLDLKSTGMNADLDSVRLSKHPFVSVHIPFYNEKNVIERSIKAATSFNYPSYEVILCDDSTDETSSKIRTFQENCLLTGESLKITKGEGWTLTEVEVRPGVTLKHLHRTTRSGYKGGALQLALKVCDPRTEYISVFDADFVPYPDTLELFLKYFQVEGNKPEIAAVQGYQWHVLNKSENWITRGVRTEYAGSYVVERSAIEIYRGLKQISGSVYMINKAVLGKIGWGTSITEDFELTLKLYEAGYKVLYTPYIQAPAECVSTIERLIRQRMRWAEGHSFNVKTMAWRLLTNPKLSFAEKSEFVYLMPYYLQALFFLIGTICWFISETIFKVHLPFWTELWGWSLVITNMVALPLVNMVGMFLEESEKKDYAGIGSFILLSYLIVPFQAYAAVKGFIEKKEGPWFRTPKTGRITDIFKRGKFYRFISEILPGLPTNDASQYLAIQTANSKFDNFNIDKKKHFKPLTTVILVILLTISVTLYSLAPGITQNNIPVAMAAEVFNMTHAGNNLSQYDDTATDGGNLSTSAAAALGGTNYGMSVLINDTNEIYGEKTISQSNTFRFRFYIDPNSLTMADGDYFFVQRILQLGGSYEDIVFVRLGYNSGTGYALSVTGRNDLSENTFYDEKNITDAPHYVEVKGVRATTETSLNGTYEWWVDGVSEGSVTGIDNYNQLGDYTWYCTLGAAFNIPATTSGTFYLDEYKLNNDGGAIGAVPENLWVFLLIVPFIPVILNKRNSDRKKLANK